MDAPDGWDGPRVLTALAPASPPRSSILLWSVAATSSDSEVQPRRHAGGARRAKTGCGASPLRRRLATGRLGVGHRPRLALAFVDHRTPRAAGSRRLRSWCGVGGRGEGDRGPSSCSRSCSTTRSTLAACAKSKSGNSPSALSRPPSGVIPSCGDFNAGPDSDEIRVPTGRSATVAPGLVFYDGRGSRAT